MSFNGSMYEDDMESETTSEKMFRLERENTALRAQLAERDARIAELQAANTREVERRREAERIVTGFESQRHDYREEIAIRGNRLADAIKERDDLRAFERIAREGRLLAERERDAAMAKAARLTEELSEARAEVERLRAAKDGAYEERNRVVAVLARLAIANGWLAVRTRTAIEGWDDEWHGCVRIELPCGQVSWHFHDSHAHLFADLPTGAMEWDGHTTEEKYRQLNDWRPTVAVPAKEE